ATSKSATGGGARGASAAKPAADGDEQPGPQAGAERPAGGERGGVRVVRIARAVVIATDDVQLPAKQPGQLAELMVEEGAEVEAGAVLAVIDDSSAKAKKTTVEAEVRIAKAQADSEAKVRAAEALARYYEAEFQVNDELFRRNVVSSTELRKFKVQFEKSVADTEVARLEFNIAGLTHEGKQASLEQASIDLEHHKVVARMKDPGTAVVAEVSKHVGDWVQLGETIMRIVRMDEVRVEGYVELADYSPEEISDQPCVITVTETLGGKPVTRHVDGKIDFVSTVITPGGDYRVWAKVKNPKIGPKQWLLRVGQNVEMAITPKVVGE
ncbi:MAG TPA: HlyD family efflux transporter periplasmic adaptor subunit, partial [Pirellulaceae bacterium]|nr:HlyD family efflux transporter periplasmic adaptor subunit [Pirellulaceae bacterium]